jgi:hypothetical protein
MLIVIVTPTSNGCADVICPSLLKSTVATDLLTSTHPLLLDRKYNLHSICKRDTICMQFVKQNTIYI